MKNKRVVKEKEIVDNDGVIKTELTTLSYSAEPPFIKLYLEDIARLYEIKGSGKDILFDLLTKMDYSNTIIINSYYRKELAKRLSVKQNTFDHALSKLNDKGILIKIALNTYRVDPNLFAKGSWADIKKIRLELSYDKNSDEKSIKTEFE